MIEGFKLRVTSAELQSHCEARAEHHKSRADAKAAEIPQLRESFAKLKSPSETAAALAHMNKVSSQYHADPDDLLEQLERDIRDHRNKALVFQFYAEHLFDDDYTLQEGDLSRLEIIGRY